MTAARRVRRFLGRDDGTTAAEYAVLLALIVLATAAAMWALGPAAGDQVCAVGAAVGTPIDP
jgi:Flp pilus assembly pilin Flp